MSLSNLASVVLPLDEQPDRPTMTAFWSPMIRGILKGITTYDFPEKLRDVSRYHSQDRKSMRAYGKGNVSTCLYPHAKSVSGLIFGRDGRQGPSGIRAGLAQGPAPLSSLQ